MNILAYRLLHRVWRLRRGMTLGVRAAVLDGEGRAFLVRHTYTPGWYLPGGGVEAGEAAGEALRRELDEEAGLKPTGEPALHGIFLNERAGRRDHVIVYVVRSFERVAVKVPDREIAEAGFFPTAALPPDATPATRRRLAEILEGAPVSPLW